MDVQIDGHERGIFHCTVVEKGFQRGQAVVLCAGCTTPCVLQPDQEIVDQLMVDLVKAYVGEGYGFFRLQEFRKRLSVSR